MWKSATYWPKNTIKHRVVDFVHALSVFLGFLWWFLGCFRDGLRCGGTIFATRRKNLTMISKGTNAYLTCQTLHYAVKRLLKCSIHISRTGIWTFLLQTRNLDHITYFSWILYLVVGQLKNTLSVRERWMHLEKLDCLSYSNTVKMNLNLPIFGFNRSCRSCRSCRCCRWFPLSFLGHAVDKQRQTLCIQL